jgi:hypothetical protein
MKKKFIISSGYDFVINNILKNIFKCSNTTNILKGKKNHSKHKILKYPLAKLFIS